MLNGAKINMLAYADDMLFLNNSDRGLQAYINVLQVYCQKWQLVLNENKTQIIITRNVSKKTGSKILLGKCCYIMHNMTFDSVVFIRTSLFIE
jgi:hypothetical protein